MNGKPLVSIVSAIYNHEKYIAQAIESFLMQKTNFPFEIVLAEDCSTDRTGEICREYQKKHPDKIRLLQREKNLGAMENHLGAIESCMSKYIANCEGDDYWTDPYKLQKQVDFLEANPEFSFSGHNVLIKFEGSDRAEEWKRKWAEQDAVTIEDIIKNGGAATGSLVWRNNVFGGFPDWFREQKAGDWSLQILCANAGKMKYFPEPMGVYRIHSGGSHQARAEESKKNNVDFIGYLYANMQKIIDALDVHFDCRYSGLFEIARYYNHLRVFDEYFAIADIKNSKKHARELLPVLFSFPLKIILRITIKSFIIYLPESLAVFILKTKKNES